MYAGADDVHPVDEHTGIREFEFERMQDRASRNVLRPDRECAMAKLRKRILESSVQIGVRWIDDPMKSPPPTEKAAVVAPIEVSTAIDR
jgi:hypothetical protein